MSTWLCIKVGDRGTTEGDWRDGDIIYVKTEEDLADLNAQRALKGLEPLPDWPFGSEERQVHLCVKVAATVTRAQVANYMRPRMRNYTLDYWNRLTPAQVTAIRDAMQTHTVLEVPALNTPAKLAAWVVPKVI